MGPIFCLSSEALKRFRILLHRVEDSTLKSILYTFKDREGKANLEKFKFELKEF